MNAKDLIRFNMQLSHDVTKSYLEDMSQEELMERPVAGANHVAWQLGHLVESEHGMLSAIGASPPALPEGFADAHGKDACGCDDPAKFCAKEEYISRIHANHEAAIAFLDGLSEDDLDKPSPEGFRAFFPTVGTVLLLTGNHELMHGGQIATVRRKLNKPVKI